MFQCHQPSNWDEAITKELFLLVIQDSLTPADRGVGRWKVRVWFCVNSEPALSQGS